MDLKRRIICNVTYKPHDAQKKIHRSRARFKVLCCGRRFGKTVFAAHELFLNLYVRNRERKPTRSWIVAPTNVLTREVEEQFHRLIEPFIFKHSKQEHKYWLYGPANDPVTGKRRFHIVELRSGESNSLKGAGLDNLIIDEAADLAEERWTKELRPTLIDTLGNVIIISTPEGQNWFWDAFEKGKSPDYPDYESWQFPSHANPYLNKKELDDLVEEMPLHLYEQEILAAFLDDSSSFFRGVQACVTSEVEPMEPPLEYKFFCEKCAHTFYRTAEDFVDECPQCRRERPYMQGGEFCTKCGVEYRQVLKPVAFVECPVCGDEQSAPVAGSEFYTTGVDLAQLKDWNVITTVRRHPQKPALRVVGFERFNNLSWRIQKARIIDEIKKWDSAAFIDATGGLSSVVEDIIEEGVAAFPVVFTNKVKAEMLHKLSVWIQQGLIEIPAHLTELIKELKQFTAIRTESGNWKYTAPENKHDDCVISLALAVWPQVMPDADGG